MQIKDNGLSLIKNIKTNNVSAKGMTSVLRRLQIGQYVEAPKAIQMRIPQQARQAGIKVKTKSLDDNTIAIIRIA